MIFRIAAALVCLSWLTLSVAQIPVLPQVKPPTLTGFASARAVIENVIRSAETSNFDEARKSLDLSRLNFALRETEGNRRMQTLIAILNRIDKFQIEDISEDPSRERVRIPIRTSGSAFAVGQIELAPQGNTGWVVTADTVDALPQFWAVVRDRPPVNGLPTQFEADIDLSQRVRARFGPVWWTEVVWLELWQWLGLGLLTLVGVVLPRLAKYATRNKALVRQRIATGLAWFTTAVIWQLALLVFDLPTPLQVTLLVVAKLVASFSAIVVGIGIVDSVLRVASQRATGLGRRADSIFFPILRNFVRFVWIVAVLVGFLSALDVNVTGLLAGLGIGGLVLALAAKDSVENVFGSVTILFDMPFGIGDWVKIGDVNGVVEEINLRSTRIRTFSDSVITLPNSNLTKAAVENFGARRRRRVDMPFAVGHANNLDEVKAFCEDVRAWMEGNERFAPDSAYAYVTAVSDTAVTVTVQGYILTADYREELEVRQALVTAIKELASAHSVTLGPHTFLPLG